MVRPSTNERLQLAKWLLIGACVLLASCVSTPPSIMRLGDQVFVTTFPQTSEIAGTQNRITVPKGFITDLASIPPLLESIESKSGPTMQAGILHDFLYWDQTCLREEADAALLLELEDSGVPEWKRRDIYLVVSGVGKFAFKKNSDAKAAGETRFLSSDYVDKLQKTMAKGNPTLKDIQSKAREQGALITYSYPNPATLKAACAAALKAVTSR